MLGASDENQLQYAVAEKRAFFPMTWTISAGSMPTGPRKDANTGGVILVDQGKYPAVETGHRLEDDFFTSRAKEEITQNLFFL